MGNNTTPIAPQGNGTIATWSYSGGAAPHECVNAPMACYGDTKYIHTSTRDGVHLFTTPPSGYPDTEIARVELFSRCKDEAFSDQGIQLGFLIGGTQYWSGNLMVTSASVYVELRNSWATNPNTSLPWTWNDIQNLQFGIKAVRMTGGWDGHPRCSQLQLIVWCNE